MTVELKPETERLVQEELDNGNFKSVDDLLTCAINFMSKREEGTLTVPRKNFSQFLLDSPLAGSGLNLDRPKSFARPIDFVSGFLIDTNFISEYTKPEPNRKVIRWFELVDPGTLFARVITLGEIRLGIEDMSAGKRRGEQEQWPEKGVPAWFQFNLLPVTRTTVNYWGAHYDSGEKEWTSTRRS